MGAAQSPSLNDATKIVLFIVAITVSTFAIGLLVCCCHHQRRRNRSNHSSDPTSYAPIAHQLDEEEIEFKKMLETQSDGIEGILGTDVDSDDLVFDSQVRRWVSIPPQY